MATTPQELLFIVAEIEKALPRVLKFVMSEEALPSAADTCAALAVRVFALDRMVRYDEIKDIEKQVTTQHRASIDAVPVTVTVLQLCFTFALTHLNSSN